MEIHIKLYSILREKLPDSANGQTVLNLEENATLADLLNELGIEIKVIISVNGVQETDHSKQLNDGDVVKIFSSVSGG